MTHVSVSPAGGSLILGRGADEEDLVRSGLEETMHVAYREVRDIRLQHDVDLRTAAMISGINKVVKSYGALGIFP